MKLGGAPVTIHMATGPTMSGLYGLDVESTYMTDRGQFDPEFRVRTVQFGNADTAWVFDLADDLQREQAAALLTDERNSFVSHTDMDVVSVWVTFGIDISARNVDTRMLASQADPDRETPADLKTLATLHGMPELEEADGALYAWMKSVWPGRKNSKKADIEAHGWNLLAAMPAEEWPEVFTRYAGLDAIAAFRLAHVLTPRTQAPAEVLVADQWLHVRATRMRLSGKRVDVPRLKALKAEADTTADGAKAKAMDLTDGVNINGPKVLPWLAQHGVDWDTWPGPLTDSGAPSLAKDAVRLLLDYPLDEVGRQVVDEMIVHRKHMDLQRKTTDITARLVGDRIHPLLNPVGASTTARMSSARPNMQNFSKKDLRMRGLFLPEPGYVLGTIDFAQVELRVVAALAREDVMLETIRAGGDLHQLTVDELATAGVTITRDQAKIVNFLIVYGGGAYALHTQTGIPMTEAGDIINAWRERYRSISALATYLGYEREAIRTVSNRRLPVTRNKKTGDTRHYANINYAVQSAAREILVSSWMRLERDKGRAGIVWWPIHDELVLHMPEDEAEAIMADAEDSMRMDFRGVPITADAVIFRDEDGVSRWMKA